jgi:hypothetical protein
MSKRGPEILVLFFYFFQKEDLVMSVYVTVGVVTALWTMAGAAMAYETFRD